MIRNILRTTITYLKRQPFFTSLNLMGMIMALTAVFFALLYSSFELNYDKYNEHYDQIYRLVTDVRSETGVDYQSAPAPLAPAIEAEYPQVKAAARLFMDYMIIQKDESIFGQENIAYADSSLFKVFSIPLIEGNPGSVLNTPMTMVISESAAKRYFKDQHPVGQILKIDKQPATVTGVMKDIPYNSHFRTDFLISISTLTKHWNPSIGNSWTFTGFYTYLLLQDQSSADQIQKTLPAFVDKHYDQTRIKYALQLEPLKTVYLQGKARGSRTGTTSTGNLNEIIMCCIIAAFILAIAIINFINLTTAYSLKRAREVGVRKVLGASKKQLVIQFMTDALLLSQVAFVLAIICCAMLLPAFNAIAGKIVADSLLSIPYLVAVLWGISLVTGFIAGLYPALSLSSFLPSKTLKGQMVSGKKGTSLRRVLVVTQFSISIVLIIATLIVYMQLFFMRDNDPGYKKDHLISIDYFFDQRLYGQSGSFKLELLEIPGITKVSYANCIPGKANRKRMTTIENSSNVMQSTQTDFYSVDDDYLQQYGMEIVAGRAFDKNLSSDSTEAMIINEAAVKSLGYSSPKDAIGKKFSQMSRSGLIIGVVKDFHFHSFQEEIRPLTFRMEPVFFTFISITVEPKSINKVIQQLDKLWKAKAPGMPLNYSFTDEAYHQLFLSEERTGKLFTILSVFAIIISCLGLFGLSAFSTEQRKKELGVRKVLGASSLQIAKLLSEDQLRPVVIAFLIASPLAWYAMHAWLQQYVYRVDISWYIFPLAGVISLLVALATIGVLTFRTSRNNPVDSLRSE
ncbi:ABC transporter permease [Pollutibacter soli]|uniref:ABC transporter permease n=1 Tax=Pollutibacter soli TaxID=3034157 RepID=UPI0030132524